MPIPKAREGEKEQEFISRCMSDEAMNKEYPERDQRYAICVGQWRKKDNKQKTPGATTMDSFNI